MELDQSSEFDTSLTNPNTFYNIVIITIKEIEYGNI